MTKEHTAVKATIVKTRLVKYADQQAYELNSPFEIREFDREGGAVDGIVERCE